jgi:hypothetical protein
MAKSQGNASDPYTFDAHTEITQEDLERFWREPITKNRPKQKRKRNSQVRERDARICIIPWNLPLDEYARRADRMGLAIRPNLRRAGCNSFERAMSHPEWRKVVRDERYNAWNRCDLEP